MNEVSLTRCGQTPDGESLYLLEVDGRSSSLALRLSEVIDVLRMVKSKEAEI